MSRAAARRSSTFSIGEVLEKLRPDFPDVTISKIRYLEAEGLIEPERTPSGYRKFTPEDVERLRYILAAQRDHYLPLRVIRQHLDAIDRGLEPPQLPGRGPTVPRVVRSGEQYPTSDAFATGDDSELRLTRVELCEAADVEESLLEQLEAFGLVRVGADGELYDGDALVITRIASEMAAYGLEPRHLRTFKSSADREVGLFEQVVATLLRQPNPEARARAEEVIRELAALSVRLHATLVRVGLHRNG